MNYKFNLDYFKNINEKHNFLLYYLVIRDFKVKYRRSIFGILWSVLNPLLMMLVVSSVFSYVFRQNIENFPVYLILGQILFNFFAESTTVSMSSVLSSASLIKKVYVPKYIFPLQKTMFSFVNFIISFIAIFIVFVIYRIPLKISMFFLPLLLIYVFLFCFGVGLFLSSSAVFFRDITHLYSVILTAWTYITPIFYPVESLSPLLQNIMLFNPMFHYIRYFRNIMLYATIPPISTNFICLGFSILSVLIGGFTFFKNQDKFILYI